MTWSINSMLRRSGVLIATILVVLVRKRMDVIAMALMNCSAMLFCQLTQFP